MDRDEVMTTVVVLLLIALCAAGLCQRWAHFVISGGSHGKRPDPRPVEMDPPWLNALFAEKSTKIHAAVVSVVGAMAAK